MHLTYLGHKRIYFKRAEAGAIIYSISRSLNYS